jgi:putative ABC transport system permease protein
MTARIFFAILALLAGGTRRAAAQAVGVAVERRLAEELGLRVGDTVRLGASADSLRLIATVAAVYEPRPDPADVSRREHYVRLHLPDLAAILGAPDRVDRFGVGIAPGVTPSRAAAALNATAFGYEAHSSAAIASESSQTFVVVSRFQRAIGIITIAASAVFLLCVMLLKVEERRLDAAVMRFVGVRRRTIFGALLLEAVAVAAAGSAGGAALAYAVGALINRYYGWFFDTTLVFSRITSGIVLFGVALSLLLGVGAGAAAAWRLVRTRPMVLWRRG